MGVAVIFTVNLLSADAVYMRACERERVCVYACAGVFVCGGGGGWWGLWRSGGGVEEIFQVSGKMSVSGDLRK